MRIVAVADTHTFESDLGALPDGDVFIHAGDIVRGGELRELEGPAEWIRSLPHEHKIVVAGHHHFYRINIPRFSSELGKPNPLSLRDYSGPVDL